MKHKINLPIVDLFVSLQGEGQYTGVPSVFMRLSGCNLRCVFKKSICDTPYSSFCPEKSQFTCDDVLKMIHDNPQVTHLVITGGEPLLYGSDLYWFIKENEEVNKMTITIETNGTMPGVQEDWNGFVDGKNSHKHYVDLYSISPKLSTSVPSEPTVIETPNGDKEFSQANIDHYNKIRINIPNLVRMVMSNSKVQLKFVYSGPECIAEIEDIIHSMEEFGEKHYNGIELGYWKDINLNDLIWLMPEGITREQLDAKRLEMSNVCIEKGWKMTDRLHIVIWGDKRGF